MLPRAERGLDLGGGRGEGAAHLSHLLGNRGDQTKDQGADRDESDEVDDGRGQRSRHVEPFGKGIDEWSHDERHQPCQEEDQEDRAESAENGNRLLQQQ